MKLVSLIKYLEEVQREHGDMTVLMESERRIDPLRKEFIVVDTSISEVVFNSEIMDDTIDEEEGL